MSSLGENRGVFLAVYTARVRISVQAGGSTIIREGRGRGASPGEVHDTALKAAETDATKRALATFGKPFGLALYGIGKSRSIQQTMPIPSHQAELVQRFGFHPDDTAKPTRICFYLEITRRERLNTLEEAKSHACKKAFQRRQRRL